MIDGPPARGDISRELVARCHEALRDVVAVPRQELWFDLRQRRDQQWERWVITQPARQRSYLRAIHKTGGGLALAAFINGQDHALLLGDALNDPRDGIRIWSYLTLARGALEAWVRAAALEELGEDPDKHLVMRCAALIDGDVHQKNLARDLDPSLIGKIERQQERDSKRFGRAGVELIYKKSKVSQVKRGEATVNVAMNVTDEAARRIDAMPGAYRVGSAAMHSGAWFLAWAMGDGEQMAPAADPQLLVTATAIVLEAHAALIVATSASTSSDTAMGARAFVNEHFRKILRALEADHGLDDLP